MRRVCEDCKGNNMRVGPDFRYLALFCLDCGYIDYTIDQEELKKVLNDEGLRNLLNNEDNN